MREPQLLSRRRRIIRAFSGARAYDANAAAQAAIAERLAGLVLESAVPSGAVALDMGCGTGALAERLLAGGSFSGYLCADISPEMLARARSRLNSLGLAARQRTWFAAMDAARPALTPRFNLAVSSMALHWAADLGAALRGLWEALLPGGRLAVAIPGEGTFQAWRDAHQRLGLPCGLQDFPSAAQLEAQLAALLPERASITQETFPLRAARAVDLPRHLKAVGAFVPRPGHSPLPPGDFRAVLRELDRAMRQGAAIEYRALFALADKPA
ncbi:methyltransferase [Fundidesulfovibrio agrisoli]|uniref:methyltransferase n=1 Tax=Fundidesulfovibrio agrisoli TaxID=2922717 RepID=UPI001FACC021|nr:methyltransferase [Fundidesulfovibrio agrisoli]